MSNTDAQILYDKFEIISCIKKDEHSSVYRALHIYLGKQILLKTLNTENISDDTILERFKREAKILAALDHPNIIKVFDFGTWENHFYISFEYFESRNLREVINNNDLSEQQKEHLFIQLLHGLQAAHNNQIVHRDIKPENILVDENNNLKIADFGLALVQNDAAITQKSSIVGTPRYMSPEQIRGNKTNQVDIFSAGIVVYELFTKNNPFNSEDLNSTITKILSYEENSAFNFDILPVKIRDAVKLMLKKRLNERAQNVGEVLKLLGENSDLKSTAPFTQMQEESSSGNLHKHEKGSKLKTAAALKKRRNNVLAVMLIVAFFLALYAFWFNNGTATNEEPLTGAKTDSGDVSRFITPLNPKITEHGNVNQPDEKTNDGGSKSNSSAGKDNNAAKNIKGEFYAEVLPWADVYIDGKKIDTTPLKDPVELSAGEHTVTLIHPDYPVYKQKINIVGGKESDLKINLKELTGYLDFKIKPWGNVSINGKDEGQTPFRKPVKLFPGTYTVKIENPDYGIVYREVKITSQKTSNLKVDLTKVGSNIKKN